MKETKLGDILTDPCGRDCVHVAICPVEAGMFLSPGQRIGLLEIKSGKKAFSAVEGIMCLGIVDPFLIEDVEPGQTFYMVLLPGSVTSMRHVWSAPGFEIKVPTGVES